MLARVQWAWPEPIEFELGQETPRAAWAIDALDRLRQLDLQPGDLPRPVLVPLTHEGRVLIREFGREIQARRRDVSGLLRSAFGKARGTALRLSLVLEELWWCARGGGLALPPDAISAEAFIGAAALVDDYFLPMAERVYGDAAATETERAAATLARWIMKDRPSEVHVRHLQRQVRLPGLRTAEHIKRAANALIDVDWLRAPPKGFAAQSKVAYAVNPRLYGG